MPTIMPPHQGLSPAATNFLRALAENNTKTWFFQHKDQYRELLQIPIQNLAAQVYDAMRCRRPDAQLVVKFSRITQDRHRKDAPYCHTRVWFTILDPSAPKGPNFWFELNPDGWNYGLSFINAPEPVMDAFRQRLKSPTFAQTIRSHQDQLDANGEFHLYGPLLRHPRPDPPDGLAIWYSLRSFLFSHQSSDPAPIYDQNAYERITNGLLSLWPFYTIFLS